MKVLLRKREDKVVVCAWKQAAADRFTLPVSSVSEELKETYRIMVREERGTPAYLAAHEKCILLAHEAWHGRLQ